MWNTAKQALEVHFSKWNLNVGTESVTLNVSHEHIIRTNENICPLKLDATEHWTTCFFIEEIIIIIIIIIEVTDRIAEVYFPF